MNKIKFRAWDYYNKKMYNMNELSFDEDGTIHGFLDDDNLNDRVYFNDNCIVNNENQYFILMQFIGRKDKNKKDIYEKDIVKTNTGLIGEIIYSEICSCFILLTINKTEHVLFCFEDIEIIGDSYQNSELLGESIL